MSPEEEYDGPIANDADCEKEPGYDDVTPECEDCDCVDLEAVECSRFSLANELWREYDILTTGSDIVTLRIENPQLLYINPLSPIHRIVDADSIVHEIPKPGVGSVGLRYKLREGANTVDYEYLSTISEYSD